MKPIGKSILAVFTTGIWVNASEFFRNEVLLKSLWIDHYQSLGLSFPSAPLNGMVWVIWGFLFALATYLISSKFDIGHTTLIGWLMGFVLMWVVTWNLSVLPVALLLYAIPLSLLEAFVAAYLCKKLSHTTE